MIEEYGTLSEKELIQEIMNQLEAHGEIDPSDLEFKFEDDKLIISGSLQNEEELEALAQVLENYVDPKDYQCNVEIIERIAEEFTKPRRFSQGVEEDEEDEEDDLSEDGLEEVEEDDPDFEEEEEEEEEEGDFNKDDKW